MVASTEKFSRQPAVQLVLTYPRGLLSRYKEGGATVLETALKAPTVCSLARYRTHLPIPEVATAAAETSACQAARPDESMRGRRTRGNV